MPIHGSSKAELNYIPSLLGVPAYNYGMEESSQAVSNALIEFELAKSDAKSPILVDFILSWFKGIGDETKFIPFANLPQIRSLLVNAGKWKPHYAVPGIRYYGSYDWYLRELLTENIELTRRVEDGYTHLLAQPTWSRDAFNAKLEQRLKTKTNYREISAQREHLERLISDHPQRHFFIVVSPFHEVYFRTFHGIEGARAFLSEIGKYPNVTVVDLSRVDYPDELFMDATHLNEDGAKRFSSDLGKILRSHPAFAKQSSSVNSESSSRN